MAATIGEVIKRLRRERRLSQHEVERRSKGKLDRDWLASIETGRSKSIRNPEKLETLARILSVSVAYIYEQAGIIPSAQDLTPEDERLLRKFHALTDEQKIAFLEFIEKMYPSPLEVLPEKKRDETRVARS